MLTLLQIVQRVCRELSITTAPASVTASQELDIIQVYALANAVGGKLVREHPWQTLYTEYRFSIASTTTTGDTVAAQSTVTGIPSTAGLSTDYSVSGTNIDQDTYVASVDSSTQVTLTVPATATATGGTLNFVRTKYTLPADFYRSVDRTQWDKTKHWEMLGPLTPQQWQFLKSGFLATGPRVRWRILGNKFQIWPGQTNSNVLGFEYLSNAWARSAAGVAQSSMLADTDTHIYDDELFVVAVKREYFAIKGFDTQKLDAEYSRLLNASKAADGGSATLSFAPRPTDVLIQYSNIPDSGYGR